MQKMQKSFLVGHCFGVLHTFVHPMFLLKMLSFFLAFSLDPQEGRFCAATFDFVATSIFPRHGDKCRLLLIEDPALEAQPPHEVAVGVFGPSPPSPPPPRFKGPNCLGGVGVKDCTWAPPLGGAGGVGGLLPMTMSQVGCHTSPF